MNDRTLKFIVTFVRINHFLYCQLAIKPDHSLPTASPSLFILFVLVKRKKEGKNV